MSLYAIFDNPDELEENTSSIKPSENSSTTPQAEITTTSAPSSSSIVTPAGWNASNRIAFAPVKRRNHLQAIKKSSAPVVARPSILAAVAAAAPKPLSSAPGVMMTSRENSPIVTDQQPVFKANPGTYEDSPRNYDPNIPNDYDTCRKERAIKAREARERLLAQAIESVPKKELSFGQQFKEIDQSRHQQKEEDRRYGSHPHTAPYGEHGHDPEPSRHKEPAPPPPPAAVPRDLSGEEAYQRRLMLSQQHQQSQSHGRYMNHQQHASRADPLTYTKCTDPREEEPEIESNVILFTNMVSLAEVDSELKDETVHECGRFGPVRSCIVHKVTHPVVPESQNVRIFVEFETIEAACAAQDQMNGRFFGGRNVLASFFPVNRYKHRDLNPFFS